MEVHYNIVFTEREREKFFYDVVAVKANSLKDIEGACIWINETAIMIGPHEISLYCS